MKVWIVTERHKYEGTTILAVCAEQPSTDQLMAFLIQRSRHKAEERERRCNVVCEEYDVE